MALQLYRLAFPQSSIEVCKQKPSSQQNIKAKSKHHRLIMCCATKTKVSQTDSRLAIYEPTIWTHDYIQVLDDNFPIYYKEKARQLEKKVMALNLNVDFENGGFSTLKLLEYIDDIERLGLGYRFQNDIRRALDMIISLYGINGGLENKEDSLYEASLRFRILRQHGYNVSQDFLSKFKDNHGGFIGCLQKDVKGLLSLNEASHLAFMEESDLHDAKLFAAEHLQKLKGQENDAQILEHINHALEVPLYHRMVKLQARSYINAFKKRQDANLRLLELATIDFNMTQAAYKKELKEVSKWWKNIGLSHNLGFARDRLMECFFWAVGVVSEPQYHSCRIWLTEVCTLITVIDDVYDVYGSLDELEIFTDAVKRWDVDAIEHMPTYLQLGFISLHNMVTEIGSKTLIRQAEDIIPILVKVWGELFEAFLVEAKWTHDKFIPKFEDYLDNAWRSVSGVVILTHGYFLINQENMKDVIESLEKYEDLMKWSSMVFRLYNDLATSSDEIERGKSVNAISCYMHEKGVCEEVARKYIITLIDEAWRKLIKVCVSCSQELADPTIDMAINLARISRCTYQYGDGHGAPDARAKDRVFSVIIEPIAIKEKELM
uniref:Terpene synthase 10 n=1 Tax=Stevia rebaudiana TaxID=55670 RepID=A0A8F9S1J0_STERE|nr:terpene synthase 10 [Stevia rebaudiana]